MEIYPGPYLRGPYPARVVYLAALAGNGLCRVGIGSIFYFVLVLEKFFTII